MVIFTKENGAMVKPMAMVSS
jgi:hypothetical protein